MRSIFNITTIEELEKGFDLYRTHLLASHHLNLTKKTKAQNNYALLLGFKNYAEALAFVNNEKTKNTPMSDKLQEMAKEMGLPCIDLKSSEPLDYTQLKGIPRCKDHQEINTVMYTDDGVFTVSFNAVEQFEKALRNNTLLKLITGLKEDSFCGGYNTDELAKEYEDYKGENEEFIEVKNAFDHIYALPSTVEDCGFSCVVEENDILKWASLNTNTETYKKIEKIVLGEE